MLFKRHFNGIKQINFVILPPHITIINNYMFMIKKSCRM